MKATTSTLPALAMGAAISMVTVSGGLDGVAAFAAGGVHLATSIRVLSHAPGAVRYAVTVQPAGGPAHAATVVIGTRSPAEWTAAAPVCLASSDRTALACELGDMRGSERRTLLMTARPGAGGPSEVPVVVQAGAANIPPVTVSRDSSQPAALRVAQSFRRMLFQSAPGDVTPPAGPWPSPQASYSAAPPSASPYPPTSPPASPPVSPQAYPPASPYANPSSGPLAGSVSSGPPEPVSPSAAPSPAGQSPVRSPGGKSGAVRPGTGAPAKPGASHGTAHPHRTHGPAGAPKAAAGPRPGAPAGPPAAQPAAPPVIPHPPAAPKPEAPPPLPVVPGGAATPPSGTPTPPMLPEIAARPSPAWGVSKLALSPAGAMQAGRVSWATLVAVAVVTEAGMLWLITGLTVWRRRRPRKDGRDRLIPSLRPLISRLLH